MKSRWVSVIFIVTSILFSFIPRAVFAKDLGVIGNLYKIAEEDAQDYYQKLANSLETHEKARALQQEMKRIATNYIEAPTPVSNIGVVLENSERMFDPSIVADKNIYNTQGQLIAIKGVSKYNPLDFKPLSKDLIYLDSTSPAQKNFLKNLQNLKQYKIILVNGLPSELEKEVKQKIYFDQNGEECSYFGINKVPVIVSRVGNQLKISEIAVGDKA